MTEVTPLFLLDSFKVMNDQLTRGYQQQTYIFTVLFLLQQLSEKNLLKVGDITNEIIELVSDKFMEELFGELQNDERQNVVEDQQKSKIKEAKGKKAAPVFEIFT